MTVTGRLAYVLLPEGAFNGTLTTEEVFAEAATPTQLRTYMLVDGALDSSHHGFVNVARAALSTQVPVTLSNGTSYTLLMAAEFSDASVPCCFGDALDAPVSFLINDTLCGDPDCCHPTDTLRELQPHFTITAGFGAPTGPVQAYPLDDFTYAFKQSFALLDSAPGSVGIISARAGGTALQTAAGAGRQETALEVTAARRAPASVRMVAQQSTVFDEASLTSGDDTARQVYVR